MSTFGELLREARQRKGLSLREVGGLTGINYANLSKMESGQRHPPPADKVIHLARVLGSDVNRFLVAAGYPVDLRFFQAALSAEAKVAPLDAPQIGSVFSQGLEMMKTGHYGKAIQLFQVLQQTADIWEVYAALGAAFYQQRQYREAAVNLKMALARVPSRPGLLGPAGSPAASVPWPQAQLFYDLALVYTDSGRLNLAEYCIKRALALPNSYEDLYLSQLCKIYTYQERFEAVLAVSEQLQSRRGRLMRRRIAGDTTAPPPLTLGSLDVCALAAYAHARLGRFAAGLALLEGALTLYDRYWYLHYVVAAVQCRQARDRLRLWNRRRRTETDEPGGQALLSTLRSARAALQTALHLNPEFTPEALQDDELRILRKGTLGRLARHCRGGGT